MRVSQLAAKTLRSAPADEVAKNAQLLIRAGFVHKEMAGVYAYLPLGLVVIENIKAIVRQEMDAIGGHELIMTTLQRPELWQKTDRWSDDNVDVWFKSSLQSGAPVGLAWSHEEPITNMMRNYIESYRDLPKFVYQFQTKLRNELRAKSGIMRGREFIMKDLYSYTPTEAAHQAFYDRCKEAYMKVFQRVGLGDDTYVTFASGGAFTQFSHEFQTLCEAGEDTIFVDRQKRIAVNREVLSDDVLSQLGLKRDELEEHKAAEVGNIFSFGTAKSEQLGLIFVDESGERRPAVLGSYGIGITRLMGVIVEYFSDEKGLVWPKEVAPYEYYLIGLGSESAMVQVGEVYERLTRAGKKVLFDDRDERAGAKFADADLLGIPTRLVISDKTGSKIERKARTSDQTELVEINALL